MSFLNNNPDSQTLLLWAAVAFAAYWLFFRNKGVESYEGFPFNNQQVNHYHHHHQEAQQVVTAPPPEEIPQYANAYVM